MKTLLAGSIALKVQSPNYNLNTRDIDIFTDEKTNHLGNVEFLYNPVIFKYQELHNSLMVNIRGLYNIKLVAATYKHKQQKHLDDIKYIETYHPSEAIRHEAFLKEQTEFIKGYKNEK